VVLVLGFIQVLLLGGRQYIFFLPALFWFFDRSGHDTVSFAGEGKMIAGGNGGWDFVRSETL